MVITSSDLSSYDHSKQKKNGDRTLDDCDDDTERERRLKFIFSLWTIDLRQIVLYVHCFLSMTCDGLMFAESCARFIDVRSGWFTEKWSFGVQLRSCLV